ncbi:ROK family glucokinase [Nocardioides marmotae]|uniref:Glucokinase n=1 Tax=Nocardioides marmotae TaxID=2663857 RepID=A0A6I3JBS1_9ACTN|nr:ROK family glucokinase [Nocardioides marmotae]MCR6031915.1 ROK family glucokinase [Gordonia jinghuaiqii]MBC9732144.1 ROK family glucokinase [Nocardioides marmotae]MTB83265.1 ROK family glucokinase [Nocardioides marmotae]MTB95555.1 ROK family glucokinase [Nocardioides marmotae]QKE00978.1 ROK family glucokinase [Nocardioides marmotae]
MTLTCGVDVGGTKIAAGVVDSEGTILEQARVESPATDAEAIEDAIAGLVLDLRTRHEITAVGVGAAGYVDKARAVVMFAPNIAWRDVPLKAELEQRVELPVVVENDANAAAWGEFVFGAGHDVDDLMLVTVGTGIGGGIVLDGQLHRGAFGAGAEIGHLRVVPDGVRCGCGNRGCFEQYASGSALVRDARAAAVEGSLAARDLLARAGGDALAITGPLITEAARAGDPFAVASLAELGRWLGEGIASLATVLDPAVVVVGGGVSEAGELLLGPIRTAFMAELPARGHRPTLEIRRARLGNRAGLIGAADLARR